MSSGRRVFLLAVLQLLAPATPTFAQGKLKLNCEFHRLVFGREHRDLWFLFYIARYFLSLTDRSRLLVRG